MRSPEIQLGEWEFYQIKLEDKNTFTEFIMKTPWPTNLWSSNFAYIWACSQCAKIKLLWKIIDGLLVTFIYTKKKKLSLFCLPFGSGNLDQLIDVLYKSMHYCSIWNRSRGFRARLRTVNSCQLDYLQSSDWFNNLFTIKKTKGLERHYSINQLMTLKGKNFDSIRKTINKFYREYPKLIVRSYQSNDYQNLLQFNNFWEKTSGKKYPKIIDKIYFKSIVRHYKELDMIILVAELNNEIIGVNIGGLLPTGESWGCICKTKRTIAGLNEAIILKLVHKINKKSKNVQYLNVGSDMGIEGLRRFKEKFKPVLNLERYRIFLK